jgi:hypothetical protein
MLTACLNGATNSTIALRKQWPFWYRRSSHPSRSLSYILYKVWPWGCGWSLAFRYCFQWYSLFSQTPDQSRYSPRQLLVHPSKLYSLEAQIWVQEKVINNKVNGAVLRAYYTGTSHPPKMQMRSPAQQLGGCSAEVISQNISCRIYVINVGKLTLSGRIFDICVDYLLPILTVSFLFRT